MTVVTVVLLLLVVGSLVYSALTVAAARNYLGTHPADLAGFVPISVLKPLKGADEGLEENLRSFFAQKYPIFEILFAVIDADDPAAPVVERLRREFPYIPAQLVVTGLPPYPNAKVFSLDRMLGAARHDLIVMGDSDVRVSPRFLETIAREMQDQRVGLITCPYRAVPGNSFWSCLEAIFINTEFLGGVLAARFLNGMDFALGPALAVRRPWLDQIGGFDFLKDFLAEDFIIGNRLAALGARVVLSSEMIEHRIGSQGFSENTHHRLRWLRSTRRSRPWGYIGQVFTNPLPLALLLWTTSPVWWTAVLVTAVFRVASTWAQAGWVLRDPLMRTWWWLVPVQDLYAFLLWIAGFFGNTVVWRGRTYYVARDGRFELKG